MGKSYLNDIDYFDFPRDNKMTMYLYVTNKIKQILDIF